MYKIIFLQIIEALHRVSATQRFYERNLQQIISFKDYTFCIFMESLRNQQANPLAKSVFKNPIERGKLNVTLSVL